MTANHDLTIALLQAGSPPYMQRTFESLAARYPNLEILVGDYSFHPSVRTGVELDACRHVRNVYLWDHRVLWQRDSTRRLLDADVAILEINPRILNIWVIGVVRKLLGRPTVLWGHAWPRKGRESFTDRIRHSQRRVADVLVTYTETERSELSAVMPKATIIAAPNSLYSRADIVAAADGAPRTDFVYVGRVEPVKKPELLLDAFIGAVDRLPPDVRLVFVGGGALRDELARKSQAAGVAERVVFAPPAWTADDLRPYYERAIVSVSPGYAGLSLIQSMGFGVMMLIARDEPHAPEIEAAVEGVTARFFASDSVGDLADVLVESAQNRDELAARGAEIAALCADSYSAEIWADRMTDAIELARGGVS